ncbi:MAG: DUF6912 family protein [Mycobacteriales bacterium]
MYLPATLDRLRSAFEIGVVGPAPLDGFAVTPGLRESYASGDLEELEYVAQLAAADRSLELLAAEASLAGGRGASGRREAGGGGGGREAGGARRVVLAVDTDSVAARDHVQPGQVEVTAEVAWRSVAAGLVDGEDAEGDVLAAIAALPAALDGDPDAAFTLDSARAHELLWYAPQELAGLG